MSGRSPGEGNDNPLQYSCLGNPMDRGASWTILHYFPRELEKSDLTTKPQPAHKIWILYLYTLFTDHYNKSSCHLSLSIFPTMYISSCDFYFLTGSLYLLISLTFHSCPPPHSLWQPPIYSLYL